MGKTRKYLSLVLALMLMATMFGVVGCGTTPEPEPQEPAVEEPADLGTLTPGRIIVGSDTAFPPFQSVVDGEIVGFDVDLMKAVA
ncbi:MAG: transporter substrate-binding domain-containing protein, partial [Actinobacteria bacterium]|nr:transporter substrate-binding domain-containing protein [Actinomycetota bacterium]